MVSVALAAVVWQWVITPVLNSASGATIEGIVSVAYPIADLVHRRGDRSSTPSSPSTPRWSPAALFLFAGLIMMLIADGVYARMLADNSYRDGGPADALWPVAYFLLAAAVMHPSMRNLWEGEPNPVRRERARMVVLGTALFAAPAVVILDDTGSSAAVTLAIITGVAALGVAWRIVRLVDESNQARAEIGESEARFRALVQHATDVVIVVTDTGTVQYVSPAADTLFGRPFDELMGTRFSDYLDPSWVDQTQALHRTLVDRPAEPVSTEFHMSGGNEHRWIEATWTNQLHEPAVRGFVGNLRDITERKRSVAFAEAETRVLEPHPLGSTGARDAQRAPPRPRGVHPRRLGFDPVARRRATDARTGRGAEPPGRVRPAGLAAHDARGHRIVPERHRAAHPARHRARGARPELNELCLSYGLRGLWSLPIRSPDGSEFLGLLGFFLHTVRDPQAGELGVLERARDLAALAIDRDARTKELGRLALQDTLTGLPNRALAQDRLEHALERLGNTDDDAMVAVLFVDLDRFKLVNDGLGHETGDELLVAVSRRLNATVRRQDTIARFGGDEFVVLCEDLGSEAQAIELADRAAQAFTEPFALSRAEVTVSASIGIAVTNRSSDRASHLLQDADAAMYRAKRRGGARHELFDEAMHTQAVSRLLTERALRRALDRDELRVLFQPEFDLASGRRVALEALLRWEHPVRGLMVPGDFLRVAEETGIIVPMGGVGARSRVRRRPVAPQRARRRRAVHRLDDRLGPPAAATRLPGARRPRGARRGRRPDLLVPRDRRELAAR